jgi:hypothetical protein
MLDTIKKSRKEADLLGQICRLKNIVESDCKRAELAIYQSRLGNSKEALITISDIRENNFQYPSVVRSVWINLSEGLISYFSAVDPNKSDGVLRAYSICNAANLSNLKSLCAAWLAQWDYLRLDFLELALHVGEAFRCADLTNHSALSRAFLVGGQALHYGGRLDLARRWYEQSRLHALRDQDDATISAIIHNMTWLNMLALRQSVFSGSGDLMAGRHALLGSESIDNYDKIYGIGSWNDLRPVLRAQILSLERRCIEALKIYETEIDVENFPVRLQSNILADKSHCYAAIGRREESRSQALLAISKLSEDTHTDDRAAIYSMLSGVFEYLHDNCSSKKYNELAICEWQKQFKLQTTAIEQVSLIKDLV